jgi:PAS domain-containing protein
MGLIKRILPPNLKEIDNASFTLEEWRVWFGGLLALIMVVVLPISFIASCLHFIPQKQYGVLALIAVLWLLLLFRAIYPSRKTLNNGILWMVVVYALTIIFFVTLGPNYARSAWLVFAAVLAALYFGAWAGLISSAFNALLLMVLWLSMDPAHPAWAETYALGLNNWLVFVAASSLLSMAASLPVGFLLGRLDSALRRVKAAHDQLALEREELNQANEALQNEMRERALSQMALRESEQKLSLLADNLPNALIYQVVVEPDGARRFTYISKSVERLNEVRAESGVERRGRSLQPGGP